MRTTVDIDDTVLAAARAIAADERISIGSALSALARRGLRAPSLSDDSGLPAFVAPPGAAPITLAIVNAHRDD